MISSMRLMNSGRKCRAARPSPRTWSSRIPRRRRHGLQPTLDDVRAQVRGGDDDVLVKSTTRPLPSVSRPSSNTAAGCCRRRGALFRSHRAATRVGLATHLLGELAALVIAHITGGAPTRRATAWRSPYSDMSCAAAHLHRHRWTRPAPWRARLAHAGRAKEQESRHRLVAFGRPARDNRTASATARTASS